MDYTIETRQLNFPALRNTFTAQARVHDLAVLDAEPVASDPDRGLIEAVLFESGRPVIVVPAACSAFRLGASLWLGMGARGQRARSTTPCHSYGRRTLSRLSALGVEKDLSGAVSGTEVASHLARHGVNVSVENLVAKQGDVAETLRSQASLFRADMIIMGAYAHSRVRQIVLGGVTQSLLKESPVPLLMAY